MIDILMATYNGEAYVEEQINSIINQTYTQWKLYIRDDGSKDNTISILEEYANKYSDKIILVKDGKRGLGAKGNFGELIKYSNSEYCMFCDQDDFWLSTKIEDSINKMLEIEKEKGTNFPILVHTDLKVVDSKLDIIDESFWSYQNLDKNKTDLRSLLVQNNITGCTMLMNKALMDLCQNTPENCIMHDWWIGLVASAFGGVYTVDKQTMLYRQHGKNEVGAHEYNSIGFIKNKLSNLEKINKSIDDTIIQAKAFYNEFKDKLSDDDRHVVYNYSVLRDKNFIQRKKSIVKNKFYKSGLVRNIGYMIFV